MHSYRHSVCRNDREHASIDAQLYGVTMIEREQRQTQVSIGNGGWLRVERRWGGTDVAQEGYVRFELSDDRFVPADVYIPRCRSVRELRDFPLAFVEIAANGTARSLLLDRLGNPGPQLDVAASFFATHDVGAGWPIDMLHSQRPDSDVKRVAVQHHGFTPVRPKVDTRLNVPTSRPYGDDFYKNVARVYAVLAQYEPAPAGRLAKDNGVPVSAVHRWVHQARVKKFLPPGSNGKRG